MCHMIFVYVQKLLKLQGRFPSPISSKDLIGDDPHILGINLIEPEIFGNASGILKGDPKRDLKTCVTPRDIARIRIYID